MGLPLLRVTAPWWTMGNSETKFFEFLCYPEVREGSTKASLPGEEDILRKLHSSESELAADLSERFKPNKRMPQSPVRDTPLVYAVRYEHKLFLNECLQRGGDPFVTNGEDETAFHVACSSQLASQRADKKRKELLQLLLDQPLRGASAAEGGEYNVVGQLEASGGKKEFVLNGSWKFHPSVGVRDKVCVCGRYLVGEKGWKTVLYSIVCASCFATERQHPTAPSGQFWTPWMCGGQ